MKNHGASVPKPAAVTQTGITDCVTAICVNGKWRRGAERRAVSFLTPMINSFRHQDASYTWHKQSRFYVFDLPAQGLVSAHTEDYTACALNTGRTMHSVVLPFPYSKYRPLTKRETTMQRIVVSLFVLAPTYRPGPLPAKYCQHQ